MAVRTCTSCGTENPADGAVLHELRGHPRAHLPGLRRRRAAPGPLLHGVRHGPRRTRRARGRLRPPPAAEPPALAEERRQVTVLFADLSGYTAVAENAWTRRPSRALVDRALRRLGEEVDRYGGTRRQVHRRQRDGAVRRARRARGRRRARGPRRPRHAGRDGRDQRARSAPPRRQLRAARRASTPARCSPARSATATRSSATPSTSPSRLQSAGRPGSVTVGERTCARHARGDRLHRARAADAEGQGRAGAGLGGVAALDAHAVAPRRRSGSSRRSSGATTSSTCSALALRPRRARAPAPPRHRDRPGGRRQVAPAARVRARARRARRAPPTFREGRCLPYGSGIVYWALGEVIRAECRHRRRRHRRGRLGQAARAGRRPARKAHETGSSEPPSARRR